MRMRMNLRTIFFTLLLLPVCVAAFAAKDCEKSEALNCTDAQYCKDVNSLCTNCPAKYPRSMQPAYAIEECFKVCPAPTVIGFGTWAHNNGGATPALVYYSDSAPANAPICKYTITCGAGSYGGGSVSVDDTGVVTGSLTCTACPTGSYSNSAGATTQCTPCPNNMTNNGVGNSTCTMPCSNPGAATYANNSWNGGATINTCVIASCNNGYTLNAGTNTCVPNVYTIKFAVGIDATAMADKTCTYGGGCAWINTTTKPGGNLRDWYIFKNNVDTGAKTVNSLTDAQLLSHSVGLNIDLRARWNNCGNNIGVPTDGWDSGECVVKKCEPGYHLDTNWGSGDGTYQTGCIECAMPGYYCPGGIEITNIQCPRGYYCPGNVSTVCIKGGSGGKCKCPIGATSDVGKSKIKDCYMPGGATGTKFQDASGKIFTLPVGTKIYY